MEILGGRCFTAVVSRIRGAEEDMEQIVKYFHLIVGAVVSLFAMHVAEKLLNAFSGSLLFASGYGADPTSPQFWLLASEAGQACIQAFIAIGTFTTFAAWSLIKRLFANLFYKAV